MNKETVLVIDDKPNIREVLSTILRDDGYTVRTCESSEKALEMVAEILPDVVVTDLRIPGMDGIELMKEIRNLNAHMPVILVTAYGTISSAVEAIKAGAYDYLTKPIDYERLKILIRRALKQNKLNDENSYLKKELKQRYSLNNILGKSNSIQKLFNLIMTIAGSNANVLIQGECGTGKELIAKAIHFNSLRKDEQLVVVDCSALPEGLLESELFGHEKGAFTGAFSRKKGRIELSAGGTLFLDEIGEMSLPLQAKLLRVLQEKQFTRVGGLETIDVDFRLIASTNRNLKEEVGRKRFRSDLYYRLKVITVKVPPLRERREDIPLLADHFLAGFCQRDGKRIKRISPEVMNYLIKYDWPGNVRELENCIERIVVVCASDTISVEHLPEELIDNKDRKRIFAQPGDTFNLGTMERDLIERALANTSWNKSMAARLLNIDRKALYNRIQKYNIIKP